MPQHARLEAARGIVNYLRKFPTLGLWFSRGRGYKLARIFDADYASDHDDRISTGAYVFTLGETPISGNKKPQQDCHANLNNEP